MNFKPVAQGVSVKNVYGWVTLVFFFWMGGDEVWAAPPPEYYDQPRLVAIQDRAYYLNHDLTFQIGYLPSDAFNKGYTVGGSYTYYLNDYIGWEVVNGNYSFNSETSLKSDLRNNFGVAPENVGFGGILDYIEWYATSNLVYTPLYTKSLLFNRRVVRGETSFVLGAGGAQFKNTGMRLMVSGGVYLRFFSSSRSSWKFDFRNNVYFERELGAVNAMSLMIGYSMQLGSRPERSGP